MNAHYGAVEQIPATVIDKGPLKNIPYMSFHSAIYEMNVYGDPAKPACIEIGVFNGTLATDVVKNHCRAFMMSVIAAANRSLIPSLNPDKDLVEKAGWTFEVTPPTGEDAYGGWWISAYSNKILDDARASQEELAKITQPKVAPAAPRPTAPVAAQVSQQSDPATTTGDGDWTASQIGQSRATTSSSSDGSVYVQGYYRKNGTYVQSYTRSAPGFGGAHHR